MAKGELNYFMQFLHLPLPKRKFTELGDNCHRYNGFDPLTNYHTIPHFETL